MQHIEIRTNPDYKYDEVLTIINSNFALVSGSSSSFSGGTVSGTTNFLGQILSGGTDLYSIFSTAGGGGDTTRVQPGANIYTGGTGNFPIINLSDSPSIHNLYFSGTAIGGNIIAAALSGTNIYSGATNLNDLFATLLQVNILESKIITKANLSGATFTGAVTSPSLSAITISGGTILSGSTNLYSIFPDYDYVNGLSLGLYWHPSVVLVSVVGDSTIPIAPVLYDGYIINTGGNTGAWSGFSAGDLIQYQAAGWVQVATLTVGSRFGVTFKTITPTIGDFVGKENYLVTITGGTPGAFTYSFHAPENNDGVYVDNPLAYYNNVPFVYSSNLSSWIQLAASVDYQFGDGLVVSGNTVTATHLTGVIYDNANKLTFLQTNSHPDLTVDINVMTGLTISGQLDTNSLSATSISGDTILSGATNLNEIFSPKNTIGGFGITIDGALAPITSGIKGYVVMPFSGEIQSWEILSNVSGNTSIDVLKNTFSSFLSDTGTTITNGDYINLNSSYKNVNTNLSAWTKSFNAGDIFTFNVLSANTINRANVSIKVIKYN